MSTHPENWYLTLLPMDIAFDSGNTETMSSNFKVEISLSTNLNLE